MTAGIITIDLRQAERKFANDDPVAQALDWHPLALKGPNLKSQELRISPHHIRVKTSRGLVMFGASIACLGFLALASIGKGLPFSNADFYQALLLSGFASLCVVVGYFIAFGITPLTLDKSSGYYYRGKYTQGPLSDIHAIQVVSKLLESRSREGDKSLYRNYQINLVLNDGSRVNAMDHGGGIASIEESSRLLSEFLRVPVWIAYD